MSRLYQQRQMVVAECGCGWTKTVQLDGAEYLAGRLVKHLDNARQRRANRPEHLCWHDQHGYEQARLRRGFDLRCRLCNVRSDEVFSDGRSRDEWIRRHQATSEHRRNEHDEYLAQSVARGLNA